MYTSHSELRVHLYADDTQLYGCCNPEDALTLAARMEAAISTVGGLDVFEPPASES